MKVQIFIVLSCLIFAGCSSVNRGLSFFHYKNDLHPLKNDSRILTENGVEIDGQIVATNLDSSIAIVESFFRSSFSKPIVITLCVTEESYIKHCGDYKNSRGMMNWGRIFLAPSAFKSNTQFAILTHELVHLHTCQKIGIFRFEGNIPAWFSEGLAVLISNGAGAEDYTDSAAIDWINAGKSFTPTKKGNLLKTSGQNDTFLPFDMFYKQSSLFIAYLIEKNEAAFHALLIDIENGDNFDKAFKSAYKENPKIELTTFKKSIAKQR